MKWCVNNAKMNLWVDAAKMTLWVGTAKKVMHVAHVPPCWPRADGVGAGVLIAVAKSARLGSASSQFVYRAKTTDNSFSGILTGMSIILTLYVKCLAAGYAAGLIAVIAAEVVPRCLTDDCHMCRTCCVTKKLSLLMTTSKGFPAAAVGQPLVQLSQCGWWKEARLNGCALLAMRLRRVHCFPCPPVNVEAMSLGQLAGAFRMQLLNIGPLWHE
eukprot:365961-Chlamydomonas_euryale.AAC.12